MSLRDLVRKIAEREGRKSQAKIGDIREIIGILSDIVEEDPKVLDLIGRNGKRRAGRGRGGAV